MKALLHHVCKDTYRCFTIFCKDFALVGLQGRILFFDKSGEGSALFCLHIDIYISVCDKVHIIPDNKEEERYI